MARVSWNDAGKRFYEAGTDRGVLYLDGQAGVPWNGLLGVSESGSGGSPRPYYLDGYKYLNLAESDEYAATIKAFTSPREFDSCDGTAAIHNGLFATQQPRKSFGFSYRTLVGNDVDGLSLGYKIHIVYNALASGAQRSYQSTGSSASAMTLDWGITTVPPQMSGIRPTAHFVIDSRLTPSRLLKVIEDILYGTSSTSPRLPSAEELSTLFTSLPPIAAVNMLVNGSFEYSSGDIMIRKNLNPNPRLYNSINGWTTTAAVATIAPTVNGAQIDLTANGATVPLVFQNFNLVAAAGQRWSSSMEVSVPVGYPAITVHLRNYSYGTNVVVGESSVTTIEPGTTVTIVANSTATILADTTGVRSILYSVGVPQGARFFVRNALMEIALVAGEYFDGSQRPKVRRNAAIQSQARPSTGWFSNDGAIYPRTWDPNGGRRPGAGAVVFTRAATSLNTVLASVYAVGMTSWAAGDAIPVSPGEVWTISGWATSDVEFNTRMIYQLRTATGAQFGNSVTGTPTGRIPANEWAQASITVTIPSGVAFLAGLQNVNRPSTAAVGGEKTKMTDALFEKVASAGEFFDSTTVPTQGYVNVSEGTVGLSPSYMYDDDFTLGWDGSPDSSSSTLSGKQVGIYSSPTNVVRGIQSKHWVKSGLYSLRQIPIWSTRGSAYTEIANNTSPRGLIPGRTYTLVINFYQKAPKGFGTGAAYRSVYMLSTTNPELSVFAQALDIAGEQEVRFVFTVPMNPANWFLRIYNGGMYGEDSVWWDNGAIFEGVYTGPAFNGDTLDTTTETYDWVGLPNQSESTLRTWYY